MNKRNNVHSKKIAPLAENPSQREDSDKKKRQTNTGRYDHMPLLRLRPGGLAGADRTDLPGAKIGTI